MSIFYEATNYKAVVIEQGFTTSKNDNAVFYLEVRPVAMLEDGEMKDLPVDSYSRTIRWTITAKTIDYTVEKLEAIGFAGEGFKDLDPNSEGFHDFVGVELDVYCKHDSYDGKQHEKWDVSTKRERKPVEPLETSKMKKLDALFGSKFKKKPKNAAKPAKRETVPAVEDDDSIPF